MTDDEIRKALETLAEFLTVALKRAADQYLDAQERDDEVQFAFTIRTRRTDANDHWQHMRNFDGADALEDFYNEARAAVSLWDVDPAHIRHSPVEIGED